jgi:hypothetical protein
LRAYAVDRLAEADEVEAATTRHLAWCIELAEAAAVGTRGADQLHWLARLDAEHDNLRAALAAAVGDDPNGALRLIGALMLPWWFRGRRQESRYWAEAALAAAVDPVPAFEARALGVCALNCDAVAWTAEPQPQEEQLALAEERARRALALAELGDDELDRARAATLLMAALGRQSGSGVAIDLDEFAVLRQRALASYEHAGDDYGIASAWVMEATTALTVGDLDRAARATEVLRPLVARCGDRFYGSRLEWALGILADAAGDLPAAYRHFEAGLHLVEELGMPQAVNAQRGALANLAERMGDAALADRWRSAATTTAAGPGAEPAVSHYDRMVMASRANSSGQRARAEGQLEQARKDHLQALTWLSEADVRLGEAFTQACLGFLALDAAEVDVAREHLAASFESALAASAPASLALALEGLALVVSGRRPDDAARLLGAAQARWQESGGGARRSHRADVEAVHGRLRSQLGDEAFEAGLVEGEALPFEAGVQLGRRCAAPDPAGEGC